MDLARLFDNRKYMWDGTAYDSEAESQAQVEKYSASGFEVKTINEDGNYYVFTRRVVKDN